MTTFFSYTPDFKCTTDGNGKGVVNASVGLLNYDEVVYAGGYRELSNSNYYLYSNKNFWMMSPAGNLSGNSYVWHVTTTGAINYDYVNVNYAIRPVIILIADIKISDGDGTKENPFVVE